MSIRATPPLPSPLTSKRVFLHRNVKSPTADLPRWMEEISDRIGDAKLGDLWIPGTDDSAGDPGRSATGVHTIDGQLNSGVRYLDLRPTADTRGDYYLCHGGSERGDSMRTDISLADLLGVTRRFLEAHPYEIVIFDFGQTAEADDNHLVGRIMDEIGPYAVPAERGADVELRELWERRERAIIAYPFHRQANVRAEEYRARLWSAPADAAPGKAHFKVIASDFRNSARTVDICIALNRG
ncbi:MAG TPA: hypothetical protein VFI91_03375 [Longimicrobiaceae bacterium]|nr:hypothetical protein [Longimicrobiaceae bacterium]